MSAELDRRLRQYRSRMVIRAWEYRQRRHARGVWFRLRRLLADADRAYVIDEADVGRLLAAGHHAEPVGHELQPPKQIVLVPAHAVDRLASARSVSVNLAADLLNASCLALVPFQRRKEGSARGR